MSTQVTQPMAENAEHRREALFVRVIRRLADSRELTLFVLVVALAVVMSVVYPNNFPTAPNMRAVLLNLAPVGILVCGMMLLMIGGTFDLSVGSTLAFAGVWAAVVAGWWGWPAEVAVLIGILVGALCGLVNGLIVTRIGIKALIATLGTLTIYRSLTTSRRTGVADHRRLRRYGRAADPLLRIQSPFWAMRAGADRRGGRRTRFFRQFYFIGGNPRAQPRASASIAHPDRLSSWARWRAWPACWARRASTAPSSTPASASNSRSSPPPCSAAPA